MASVRGAITALATFGSTIILANGQPAVKKSYDIDKVPESLNDALTPCFIVFPQTGQDIGFKTLAFMGNAPIIEFNIAQYLLYKSSNSTNFADIVPTMIDILDAYLLALKATPFYGSPAVPPVHYAALVKPNVTQVTYAGVSYHGIEFLHTMKINL
jgi:hypothetical protein